MSPTQNTYVGSKVSDLKKRKAQVAPMKPAETGAYSFNELKKRVAPKPYMMAKPLYSEKTLLDGPGPAANNVTRKRVSRTKTRPL